ncbi:MAG: zinc ABC transporter substrate-binding protein [Anaerolineales bacterium]
MKTKIVLALLIFPLMFSACAPASSAPGAGLRVVAVETFLADIAQNVAGDRLKVESLMPVGMDPHAFSPAPQDVIKIAQSDVLIVNGAGLESWLEATLNNAGGQHSVVEAAHGIAFRQPGEGNPATDEPGGDPHFWFNPLLVIRYTENIRDGLIAADPAGREIYSQNAEKYIGQLKELDQWIQAEVAKIPPARRLLVTDHETFGYFAERYGFTISGVIVPSYNSGAAPSAQQLAGLVDQIRASASPAIFLEAGSNPQLADQLSSQTGVAVISDLYTHSITSADGPAPTYLAMMRYNVKRIVEALK